MPYGYMGDYPFRLQLAPVLVAYCLAQLLYQESVLCPLR